MEERILCGIAEHKHPESGYDYWHPVGRGHTEKINYKPVQTLNIKNLVDSGYWKEIVSIVAPTEDANYSTCPSCKKCNTRRIQNALTFIRDPAFNQGEEWLGYCHDCGTLYEYYTGVKLYSPKILLNV